MNATTVELQQRASLKDILLDFPQLLRLLYRLIKDPRVSKVDKGILGGILIYVLDPFDLMPDFIPLIGEIDDAYLIALGFIRLLNRTNRSVVEELWEGRSDIGNLIQAIVRTSMFYLPSRARAILVGKAAEPAAPQANTESTRSAQS